MKCFNLNLGGGGLCNRLRTLYSHYTYCLENGLNLVIYNIPTDYCIEDFSYYLVFPNNMSFIYEKDYRGDLFCRRWNSEKKLKNCIVGGGFVGCSTSSPHSNNEANHKYDGHKSNIYSELKFSPEITKMSIDEKYIALHIRRTDISSLSNTYPMLNDSYYMDFIDSYDSNLKIYIATDNKETLDIFKKKYGSRIINNSTFIDRQFGLRKTSAYDVIVDLFLCIQSTFFLGTRLSSMTDLIYQYRYFVLKNNNASELEMATSITYKCLHMTPDKTPPLRN